MKSKTYRLLFLDRPRSIRWGEVVKATSDDAAMRFAADIKERRRSRRRDLGAIVPSQTMNEAGSNLNS